MLPSGHSDWPSGQTTLFALVILLNAWIFFDICITVLSPLEHVPSATSQVYPFGQQCTPSLQQTAFGRGQQPHWPEDNLQQVVPSGHSDRPSGQTTLFALIILFNAGIFFDIGIAVLSPFVHVPSATSQVYPFGQQCSPSLQQTAWGSGQQPHWPEDSLQHVVSPGHFKWPSGQTILFTWCLKVRDWSSSENVLVISCRSLFTPFIEVVGSVVESARMLWAPDEQPFPSGEHVYPRGQQCLWSAQHTASSNGQHKYPWSALQQVYLASENNSVSL